MRFAAVSLPEPEPEASRAPLADAFRRWVSGGKGAADAVTAQESSKEVPLDLDQRVRLVGEW